MNTALVIGFGSSLRCDDAAGQRAAERFAARERDNIHSLAVHQLTPELVERLIQVELVVFVDATAVTNEGSVKAKKPRSTAGDGSLGHSCDPNWLLCLCNALYGHCPEAWLVTIPTTDLGIGEGLSATAESGVQDAVRLIEHLIMAGVDSA
jgi:hydrogenase maturation protease